MFVADRKHFVETLLQQRVLFDFGSIFAISNTLHQEVLEELVEPAGVVVYDLVPWFRGALVKACKGGNP